MAESSKLREIVKEHFGAKVLLEWDQKEEVDLELYFTHLVRQQAHNTVVCTFREHPDNFLGSLIQLGDLKFVRIFFNERVCSMHGGVYILEDLASFGRLDIVDYLLSLERTFICQKTAEIICGRDITRHPEYVGLLRQMILTGERLEPPVLSWRTNFIERMLLLWEHPLTNIDRPLETVMMLNTLGFGLNRRAYELMKPRIDLFEKVKKHIEETQPLNTKERAKNDAIDAWLEKIMSI